MHFTSFKQISVSDSIRLHPFSIMSTRTWRVGHAATQGADFLGRLRVCHLPWSDVILLEGLARCHLFSSQNLYLNTRWLKGNWQCSVLGLVISCCSSNAGTYHRTAREKSNCWSSGGSISPSHIMSYRSLDSQINFRLVKIHLSNTSKFVHASRQI